ncbi:ANK [Mytilus coruscus]|uniref:ANK n=1 Tax=Mytilus coruscus TaxID=42192 RepID=A0A6J8ALW1_MYTCO|nr:ANK [Mytilus coruscus]
MGDLRNVNVLLNHGAPVDQDTLIYYKEVEELFGTSSICMTRATPLHIACWKDDFRIVQQVLGGNATCSLLMHNYYNLSADEKECDKLSPLCISVLRNNYSTVTLLLQSKPNSDLHIENSIFTSSLFNQGNKSSKECYMDNKTYLTPFQAACILGYVDIAEELLENHVDVNQRFKVTPIILSICARNHVLMQKFLSSNGFMDKNFEIEVTPLIFAVLVENLELLKMLLSNYADHESEVTICLLHVIPFHEDILNVLTSASIDLEQLLLSECTMNPFLIACLKDNNDMCHLFFSKYADPLYATQLTAMHVICFKGYDKHLKIMIEERLQLSRYFRIQCSHFIAIGNLGEINDELVILSTGCNDVLHISNLELACLDEDVYILKHILDILPEKSYNSVMKITPLLLSYLFENCAQLGIGIFLSNADLCSCISYNLMISWFLYKRYGDTGQHSKKITFDDSIQLSDLSLLLKFCCAGTSDIYEFSDMFDASDTASVGKIIKDRLTSCEENLLTSFLLDFNENKDDETTVLELLQHTDVCKKMFLVNCAYLLLFRNIRLDSLPLSAYSELSHEPLSFTAVEAFHLIQRRIPHCFLSSTEAKYRSL